MSKDKIAHLHARTVPYATPRRPLHTEASSFIERGVRQAPACTIAHPLVSDPQCCIDKDNRAFVTRRSFPSNPAYQSGYVPCERVACENPDADIKAQPLFILGGTTTPSYNSLGWCMDDQTVKNYITVKKNADNKCCFFPDGDFPAVSAQSGGSFYNPISCQENAIRAGNCDERYCAYPEVPYKDAMRTVVPYVGAATNCSEPYPTAYNVSAAVCNLGLTNSTAAKQVPTYPIITDIGKGCIPVFAATASSAAAYLLPTPTATIAASAANATVTGLAVGLGVLGSGVVIGGALFAGYKLGQYCKPEAKITPSAENIYEELEMDKKELIDEPAWANLSECPFERPFAD